MFSPFLASFAVDVRVTKEGAVLHGHAGGTGQDDSSRRDHSMNPSPRLQGAYYMAVTKAIKPVTMYSVSGKLRHKNAIYENELVVLLKKGTVRQLVIFCRAAGYSLAVLTDHRADMLLQPYTREGSKVIRLRQVNIEQEGFAPLHSIRNKAVRQYRSLDTLVNSLKRCGPLPPIYLRQGASK